MDVAGDVPQTDLFCTNSNCVEYFGWPLAQKHEEIGISSSVARQHIFRFHKFKKSKSEFHGPNVAEFQGSTMRSKNSKLPKSRIFGFIVAWAHLWKIHQAPAGLWGRLLHMGTLQASCLPASFTQQPYRDLAGWNTIARSPTLWGWARVIWRGNQHRSGSRWNAYRTPNRTPEKSRKNVRLDFTAGRVPHDMPIMSEYMSNRMLSDMPDNVKIDVRKNVRTYVR